MNYALDALQNGRILVGTCPMGALIGLLDWFFSNAHQSIEIQNFLGENIPKIFIAW